MTEKITKALMDWGFEHGIAVVGVIIVTLFIHWVGKKVIVKSVQVVIKDDGNTFVSKEAETKRENTLIRTLLWAWGVLVFILGSIKVLAAAGVDTAPFLATAGVAGVAIAFGGQYLIKDLISGLFMILENQYRVGDVVKIAGIGGLVEDITLRKTVLRDLDQNVHHIPHGSVTTVTNMTKGHAGVNLNIGIAYDTDSEKLEKIINRVGQELTNDPKWKEFILEAPKFERVDDLGGSAVEVKILGKTIPIKQWAVTGELRKRLWVEFRKEGIEIPFPQMVIHRAN